MYLIKNATAKRRAAYGAAKASGERCGTGARIVQPSQVKVYSSSPVTDQGPSNKIRDGPVAADSVSASVPRKANAWINIDGSLQYLGEDGKLYYLDKTSVCTAAKEKH